MTKTLEGRVALLTGAARGIGFAIARAFAEHGADVVITDIDAGEAQRACEELRGLGIRAEPIASDITDLEQVLKLVPETVRLMGGLHILVNNAGIQANLHFGEQSIGLIESQLRGNAVAPLLLCRDAAPIFRAQRWGRILNIGSVQGDSGNPGNLPYSMSKAALHNLTQAMARELGPFGVTVHTISPGYIDTLRNRQRPDASDPDFVRRLPLRRGGKPEDIAPLALLLAGEGASYMTGQTIYVDGGLML